MLLVAASVYCSSHSQQNWVDAQCGYIRETWMTKEPLQELDECFLSIVVSSSLSGAMAFSALIFYMVHQYADELQPCSMSDHESQFVDHNCLIVNFFTMIVLCIKQVIALSDPFPSLNVLQLAVQRLF